MEKSENDSSAAKLKMLRCRDWLQKQNESKKLLQNKNDIQFIIQTNADRKNFLISAAEDDATVPAGVNEPDIQPKVVPIHYLRVHKLNMECEWQSCRCRYSDYDMFRKHVYSHVQDLHVIKKEGSVEYVCLWDICGYTSTDFEEMVCHVNYHAYHAKLLAIGFNGRATLQLQCCKKDSSKRNQLPKFPNKHLCMWTGCDKQFNSIQSFFDHVRLHTNYSEQFLCSWGGCGAKFHRRVLLTMHVRSHTGERLIACYHCGQHFACNRKLCDHLRRQNVYPNTPYSCSMCGIKCASEYLLNEHARRHVSTYACTLCDMSAPSAGALAHHVRYRHLDPKDTRVHKCPHCDYKAISNWDLRKHVRRHKKRDLSDDENSEGESKVKVMSTKKYACHMCPEKSMKIFSRGTRLTSHLVKDHGAQWPFGHSRFRYQISEDGMYRLTTTRYEVLEVSKKIVDGYSGPKDSLTNQFEFKVETEEATASTPKKYKISLKNDTVDKKAVDEVDGTKVEITMCDVDEEGNIIKSEVFKSEYVYG
ncbi:hypothetical protein K1T71_009415 [Dendrolimus kikuchii]|uniref:Uncharacterized protein n=1 Tax=Dendrolimus kikuchii TaxID=765133 RepID=A0ACC1CUA9_9NEOP|nr:hypothetical protein K1T71_009415 [Dendrolimus kikuchii]